MADLDKEIEKTRKRLRALETQKARMDALWRLAIAYHKKNWSGFNAETFKKEADDILKSGAD